MLSVVITAWNEAENLPVAVKSVQDLADEIVVVDTESTDDTVAVARKLGCKVYSHPNTGIVEPVRNFSVSKTKGDWILLLDADEEVSPILRRAGCAGADPGWNSPGTGAGRYVRPVRARDVRSFPLS